MEIGSNLKQSTALAAAAAAAASSGAMAADMSVKAPAPLPPPQTWQGVYFGGSVGASWLHSTQDDTAAVQGLATFGDGFTFFNSNSGGSVGLANGVGYLGGLNLGFNLQSGNFVYGLEGNFSWLGSTSASSNSGFTNTRTYFSGGPGGEFSQSYTGTTSRSSKVSELAMLRARAGFDFNGTLPYITAGVAWGRIQNTFSITGYSSDVDGNVTATATQTSWVPGIVLGGGIEHKFTQNLSLRAEMAWVGFADRSLANPLSSTTYRALTSNGAPIKFSNELTIGTIGLNYRY